MKYYIINNVEYIYDTNNYNNYNNYYFIIILCI